MSLRYPHWIRVTTPGDTPAEGGGDAGDGGGFGEPVAPAPETEPVPDVVWLDCACDVQDVGQVIPRNATGLPENRADATIFVADEHKVFDVPIGATAVVQFAPGQTNPRAYAGQVTYARELDGALLVRFPDQG